MYSDVFCRVYNEFGWNYYPEIFGQQLLRWMEVHAFRPKTALDLACGTGILCQILDAQGITVWGMDLSDGMIRIAKENSPQIHYDVANMITYRPEQTFDLVTCTGDAVNHISSLSDVEAIFRNIKACLKPGGYFVFDLLNEREVSTSEPFEMDFSDTIRVWFQMTRPTERSVNLCIRVYEKDVFQFEENIRETIHDPEEICRLLEKSGLKVRRCADRLLEENNAGTTWFLVAQQELE